MGYRLQELPTSSKHLTGTIPRKQPQRTEGVTSESDGSDTESEENVKYGAEGFDYKQWEQLDVPVDIKELFQYISR